MNEKEIDRRIVATVRAAAEMDVYKDGVCLWCGGFRNSDDQIIATHTDECRQRWAEMMVTDYELG